MATTTTNLELFKYDTIDDATTVFDINKALNDNWDSIDSWANGVNSLLGTFSQSFATASDSSGKKVFQDILTELDKKLEAEVSLSENGYIKFNSTMRNPKWIFSACFEKILKLCSYFITQISLFTREQSLIGLHCKGGL